MGLRLQTVLGIILLCLFLTPVVYPALDGGGSAPEPTASTPCAESPDRSLSSVDDAPIVATVSRDGTGGGLVNISYEATGDDPSTLDVLVPWTATIVDSSGFDRDPSGDARLTFNDSATSNWITYRMNEGVTTTDHDGGDRGREQYPFAEDWLFAALPAHHHEDVRIEPEDAGYVGSNTVFLGEYELHSRTVSCQTFQVVVPDDVWFLFSVDDRLDDLEAAATTIPGGQRFETVNVFVSPDALGATNGFVQEFENDIVVRDTSIGSDSSILWMHEYVHTLQDVHVQPDLGWTTEAFADYLAYKVALEHGHITRAQYDSHLGFGATRGWEVPLSEAAADEVAYYQGAALLAEIDRDLQAESEKTIYDVFDWLNEHPYPGHEEFMTYLRTEAGLPAETIASYDATIRGDRETTVDYHFESLSRLPAAGHLLVLEAHDPAVRFVFAGLSLLLALVLVRAWWRYLRFTR